MNFDYIIIGAGSAGCVLSNRLSEDKDNKVVSGDAQKVKKVLDTWKFTKDSTSKNPNWLIIDTQA